MLQINKQINKNTQQANKKPTQDVCKKKREIQKCKPSVKAALGRQRQEAQHKYEASLLYIASLRSARLT